MDYKELSKKSKDIGESLVDAGEKLLSSNICTAGNTLIEASVAIAELLERAEQAEAKLLYTQECVTALSLLLKAIDGKMRMDNILPMARNRLNKYRKRFPFVKIVLNKQNGDG